MVVVRLRATSQRATRKGNAMRKVIVLVVVAVFAVGSPTLARQAEPFRSGDGKLLGRPAALAGPEWGHSS